MAIYTFYFGENWQDISEFMTELNEFMQVDDSEFVELIKISLYWLRCIIYCWLIEY